MSREDLAKVWYQADMESIFGKQYQIWEGRSVEYQNQILQHIDNICGSDANIHVNTYRPGDAAVLAIPDLPIEAFSIGHSAPVVWVSLHYASPGVTGAHEANYGGYARVSVPQTNDYWETNLEGSTYNTRTLQWGACTFGSQTITHFALWSNDKIIVEGRLQAAILVTNGITLAFVPEALVAHQIQFVPQDVSNYDYYSGIFQEHSLEYTDDDWVYTHEEDINGFVSDHADYVVMPAVAPAQPRLVERRPKILYDSMSLTGYPQSTGTRLFTNTNVGTLLLSNLPVGGRLNHDEFMIEGLSVRVSPESGVTRELLAHMMLDFNIGASSYFQINALALLDSRVLGLQVRVPARQNFDVSVSFHGDFLTAYRELINQQYRIVPRMWVQVHGYTLSEVQ